MSRFGKLVYDDAGAGKLVFDGVGGGGKLVYADSVNISWSPFYPADWSWRIAIYDPDYSTMISLLRSTPLVGDPDHPSTSNLFWHYTWLAGGFNRGNWKTVDVGLSRDNRDANNATITKVQVNITTYVNTGGGKMWVGVKDSGGAEDISTFAATCISSTEVTGLGMFEIDVNKVVSSDFLRIAAWQDDVVALDDYIQGTVLRVFGTN